MSRRISDWVAARLAEKRCGLEIRKGYGDMGIVQGGVECRRERGSSILFGWVVVVLFGLDGIGS